MFQKLCFTGQRYTFLSDLCMEILKKLWNVVFCDILKDPAVRFRMKCGAYWVPVRSGSGNKKAGRDDFLIFIVSSRA